MSEEKTIKIRLADGTSTECTIEVSHVPPWKLIFSGMGFQRREFPGNDLFEVLVSLRRELEQKEACQILCAGARVDVFPSGMSRSMGGGRKAYITRLGFPAGKTDLIDIFDYAEASSVGSVEQQKEFHERWITSLQHER